MAPNLLFYQILLVALVLICFVIYVGWPDDPRNNAQRSALHRASLSGRVFKPFDVGKYLIQQLKE